MVESDVRCRESGPIEHSIVRAAFTVASVRTVLLDVLIGGAVAIMLIKILLPKVVTWRCSKVAQKSLRTFARLYWHQIVCVPLTIIGTSSVMSQSIQHTHEIRDNEQVETD